MNGREPKRKLGRVPQALLFDNIPTARDYRLADLPRDSQGNVLYAGTSQAGYHAYVDWIADYLHTTKLPANSRQDDLCRAMRQMTAEAAVAGLGMQAAFYDNTPLPLEVLEAMVEPEDVPESTDPQYVEW